MRTQCASIAATSIGAYAARAVQVMAMWLWIALFTLPFMYRACRHALDALVEETLLFVAEVVRGGAPPCSHDLHLPDPICQITCAAEAAPAGSQHVLLMPLM